MSKRYVLLKSDGEGPKPCAFFASPVGCRNASGCKFLHGDQPTAGSIANAAVAVAPTPAPAAPAAVNGPSVAEDEAERAAKKAKKKAKKEKDTRQAAALAETSPAPVVAAAERTPPTQPPGLASLPSLPPAPVAMPVVPVASTVLAPPAEQIAAKVVSQPTLSKTKAKKQALREKAARKAEAAAALAASNAAACNAAAVAAAAAAASATPLPVVAPAGASGTPVANAAVPPVSKKKKRKNKKKAGAEPAAPAAAAAAAAAKPTTQVCSFFNKKKGCQVGALCPFLHQGIERGGFGGTRSHARDKTPPATAVPVATATVVPARASPVAVVEAAAVATPNTKRAKPTLPLSVDTPANNVPVHSGDVTTTTTTTVPSLPIAAPPATPPPTAVAQTTGVAAQGGVAGEVASSRRRKKRGRSEAPASAAASPAPAAVANGAGIFDGLPVSPFVMPDDIAAAKVDEEPSAVPKTTVPPVIPHPRADVWQELVERTRAHPSYAKSYSFKTDATWITASPCGEACADLPQVLAMDCEMCMSEDPVTKERNGKELLRLSIVSGVDGEKLMDTLVRPTKPVLDWRADIHGVKPEHMKGVTFTHRHAQEAMSRVCCKNTVIIGHALYNDLHSLKMTHDRVVDTSFLYEGSDKKFSTPSLKDVVKGALGKDVQEGSHDSVTDSQCTLDVAKYALDNAGAPLPAIVRTKKSRRRPWDHGSGSRKKRPRSSGGDGADAAKMEKEARSLMVHRLPRGTTPEQLSKVMQKKTKVVEVEVGGIEFTGATGKALVVYGTKAQAAIAFNGISTKAQEDTSGRLQKRIYTSLDGKSYIAVRHAVVMADGAEQGLEGLPDLSSSSSASEEEEEEEED